jgi:hypothetical protein
MARTPASDPIVDALESAHPVSNGNKFKLDALTPEQQASVIRARERKLGFQTIAKLLTVNGFPCGSGAVESWLRSKGVN